MDLNSDRLNIFVVTDSFWMSKGWHLAAAGLFRSCWLPSTKPSTIFYRSQQVYNSIMSFWNFNLKPRLLMNGYLTPEISMDLCTPIMLSKYDTQIYGLRFVCDRRGTVITLRQNFGTEFALNCFVNTT